MKFLFFLYCVMHMLITSAVGAYLYLAGHWFLSVIAIAVIFKSGEALAEYIWR